MCVGGWVVVCVCVCELICHALVVTPTVCNKAMVSTTAFVLVSSMAVSSKASSSLTGYR